MTLTDHFEIHETKGRPFPLSIALALAVAMINITATVLSLLAA